MMGAAASANETGIRYLSCGIMQSYVSRIAAR
jgi:hypothetical protein